MTIKPFIASGELEIKDITITDVLGRTVLDVKYLMLNTVNVSGLTSGLYTIQITTEQGIVTRKFVKK